MFKAYEADGFFDEMFDTGGGVRPHYKGLLERFSEILPKDFEARRASCDQHFLRRESDDELAADG